MIRKAVIPAAGLGTRFLPATKAQPKEMLPIVDTPTIQYVVQEAVDSGIRDILIVTGKGKRAIEDHFDRNFELEAHLQSRKDNGMLEAARRLADMADLHFIRQKEMNGLGDAIAYARSHTGNEPFAVLLGDTVVDSVIPATQQLLDMYEQYRRPVIAVEEVPADLTHQYGICGVGKRHGSNMFEVDGMVEKPPKGTAPSNLSITGRYILQPEIFKILETQERGAGGEIQLTDAMIGLAKTQGFYGVEFEGERHDCGSKAGFLRANIAFGMARADLRDGLRAEMKHYLERT